MSFRFSGASAAAVPFARACFAVAGSVLICGVAGSTAAAGDSGGGKLAYVVHGARHRSWIVAEDTNGMNVRRLVPPAEHGWGSFDWAPDGRSLFAERRGASGDLDAIVVASDGGASRIVVEVRRRMNIRSVRWSPDSGSLAFIREPSLRCAGGAVWRVRADGSQLWRVTRPVAARSTVVSVGDWSPDGQRLLYQATRYERGECGRPQYAIRSLLITIGVDGSARKVVTQVGDEVWGEAWSPDGSEIAYLTCVFHGELPCQPWVVDSTGAHRHRVGTPVNMWSALGLNWTRDGRGLVIPFLCGPGQCSSGFYCDPKTWLGGLRVIDVQTGHTRTVVSRVGCRSAALMAISRDGSLLGFFWNSLQANSNQPLMLVGLDGSELRTVTAVPVPDVAGGRAKWEDVGALYLP
jgi:WD40-like Beta Propeller Repeat